MPRLKVEAAKPPKSVTMPPPRFTINEWRVAPMRCSSLHTWLSDSSVLWVSVAGMVISCAPLIHSKSLITGRHKRSVVSSHSTNKRSCLTSSIACVRLWQRSLDMIIFCFSIFLVQIYNYFLNFPIFLASKNHKYINIV